VVKGTYLLFAGDEYYPCGGIDDLVSVIESVSDAEALKAAQANVESRRPEWAHLCRVESGQAVTVCEWSGTGSGRDYVIETSLRDATSEQGGTGE